jgi:hypothetical protein
MEAWRAPVFLNYPSHIAAKTTITSAPHYPRNICYRINAVSTFAIESTDNAMTKLTICIGISNKYELSSWLGTNRSSSTRCST